MDIDYIAEELEIRYAVVLVTARSEDEAAAIGSTVVEEGLAACVNIVPGMISIFKWKGNIERDHECLMIIKTRVEVLPSLVQRVKSLHSYDVPEVIALPIVGGNQSYLEWIDEVTRSKE